jgi:hypothetical protein
MWDLVTMVVFGYMNACIVAKWAILALDIRFAVWVDEMTAAVPLLIGTPLSGAPTWPRGGRTML